MADTLQRFLFENEPVRGEFIRLNKTYKQIVTQHKYPYPIRRLIGEALCVAGLLAAIIKFTGRLSVQFRGNGKLKMLLAQSDNKFRMRALAKWEGEDDLSYEDLLASFHDGVLVIMLDTGREHNQYQGIVTWQNSLTESIEAYFKQSEQLATRIWLTVDDENAAGLLLQIIPGKNKRTTIDLEPNYPYWQKIVQATDMNLDRIDMLAQDYQLMLNTLYPGEEVRVFKPSNVIFRCTCSRKRGEDAILILGEKEAQEELQNNKTIVVTCDFCNKEYVFDRVDVANLFKNRQSKPDKLH